MHPLAAIRTYFLRKYAGELSSPNQRRKWGPFREAVFQTVWIVTLPVVVVAGTALYLLLATRYRAVLADHRGVLEIVLGLIIPLLVYTFVRSLVGEFENRPEATAAFASEVDQRICKLQFQIMLAGAIAWPFVIVGFRYMLE